MTAVQCSMTTMGIAPQAAKGHRFQALTLLTRGIFIPGSALQDSVLDFYSATTGFNSSAPLNADGSNPTDLGGNMQDIAEFLVKIGMKMPDGSVDKFVAAFMIDPSNIADLLYCGAECVGIDFGFTVTTNVMPQDGSPSPKVWLARGTAPRRSRRFCSWGSAERQLQA